MIHNILYSKTTRKVTALIGLTPTGYTMRLFETEGDAKRAERFNPQDRVTRYAIRVEANSHHKDDPRVNGDTPIHQEHDERFTAIAAEIVAEAQRSIDKHGEQGHLPMGTGAGTHPLATYPGLSADPERESGLWPGMLASVLARIATRDTKAHSHNEGGDGTITWWHILREEVLEAAAEDSPAALRIELLQIAAVALKWIEALDA